MPSDEIFPLRAPGAFVARRLAAVGTTVVETSDDALELVRRPQDRCFEMRLRTDGSVFTQAIHCAGDDLDIAIRIARVLADEIRDAITLGEPFPTGFQRVGPTPPFDEVA